MAVRFHVYGNFGAHIGEVEAWDAEHRQAINGDDSLKFSCGRELAKRDRIVWEEEGAWHEACVCSSKQNHELSIERTVECRASYQDDLRLAHVARFVANNVTAEYVLGEVLRLCPGWSVGECDDFGKNSVALSYTTAYKALLEIAGTWGCEIEPVIEVGPSGVERRSICLRRQRGGDFGARIDYAWNMDGITREVNDDDVYTAVYGYGKQLDSSSDGVSNRLTFSSINGGKPYVTFEGERLQSALEQWGVPDGQGGAVHAFGVYDDSQCETAQELKTKTMEYLEAHCAPSVTYETSVPFEALRGVWLGDVVHVVDTGFDPPVRLAARVGELTRDLTDMGTASCTFGTVKSVLPDVLARTLAQSSTALQVARTAADAAAGITDKVTTDKVTAGSVTIEGEGDDRRGTLTVGPNGELIWTDANGVEHTLAGDSAEGGGGQ